MTKEKLYSAEIDEIIVLEGRIRRKFTTQTLNELADSISRMGQLQPGVCRLNPEGKHELIMGERRLRACGILKIPFIYRLKEEITDPAVLLEIELEENLRRDNLAWQEEVDAKLKLHELWQSRKGVPIPGRPGGQRIEDTAEAFGQSRSIIHEDIKLAMFADSVPEVAKAKTKSEARKIVKRIEQTVGQERALEKALNLEDEPPTDSELEDEEIRSNHRKKLAKARLESFMARAHFGEMEEILPNIPASDIVIWDPPWGVEYDKVQKESGITKTYKDPAGAFKEQFPIWLSLIYEHMEPHSHLYLFFAITWHEFVYEHLAKVGFETNRIPILWHKKGAHRTRNPTKWPGRCYEPIAFAHKGNKGLVKEGRPDIVLTPQPTRRMRGIHPSVKHPDIFRDLIHRSGLPGDKVLDPMCGSNMSGVAFESLRSSYSLNWSTIEHDKDYYNQGILSLNTGYSDLIGESDDAPAELPDEIVNAQAYRGLVVGGPEWVGYWEKHPEDHEAMLEWKKSIGG